MYLFEKRVSIKTAGPGVTTSVQIATRCRHEVAAGLKVGEFVIFDKHDDELEPIWLGRVMPNPEWNGQGVYKNKTGRNLTFRGVGIGKGEVAIYVMWYEKKNVMSDELEYWVSRSETEPLVQNNKYLLPILEVKMHRIVGQPNKVPMLRIGTRTDMARAEMNTQTRIQEWHNKEIDIVWSMDLGLRREALALCGDM